MEGVIHVATNFTEQNVTQVRRKKHFKIASRSSQNSVPQLSKIASHSSQNRVQLLERESKTESESERESESDRESDSENKSES